MRDEIKQKIKKHPIITLKIIKECYDYKKKIYQFTSKGKTGWSCSPKIMRHEMGGNGKPYCGKSWKRNIDDPKVRPCTLCFKGKHGVLPSEIEKFLDSVLSPREKYDLLNEIITG